MQLINVLAVARTLARGELDSTVVGGEISFGSVWFFVYAALSCFLVLFAGMMSGLTLGLMSIGPVDLEILQRSGTDSEKKQAGD